MTWKKLTEEELEEYGHNKEGIEAEISHITSNVSLKKILTCPSCGNKSIFALSSLFGTFGFCLNCYEIYEWKKGGK